MTQAYGPCWVLSGGFPCGARETGEGEPRPHPNPALADKGARVQTRWLLVNIMGQILPQQYRRHELHQISARSCARLGLCPHCLGYGRVVTGDQQPVCPVCTGSGRTGFRTELEVIMGEPGTLLTYIPHRYVRPRRDTLQACLACGMAEDDAHHVRGTSSRARRAQP